MKKLIIAHRGASKEVPENTLAAFQRAIDAGADMIETDIRKTKDDVLVLYHDPDIEGRKIAELSLEELIELSQNQIPTLEEALKFCQGKIKLDFELKQAGYEKQVVELILKRFTFQEFIMTSSLESALSKVKSSFPQVQVGLIVGNRNRGLVKNVIKLIFRRIPKFCDLLVVNWFFWLLGLHKLDEAKKLFVFTIDSPKIISKLFSDSRVDGIIMNDPIMGIKQ